jgi:transglutaminase-like putative cysteine protease
VSSDGASALRAIKQQIQVINPPGEQNPYLLGASQLASTDQPAVVVYRKSDGSVLTWLRSNGKLAAGNQYTVTSYISAADVQTLQSVPLPVNAPKFTPNPDIPDLQPPPGYYAPDILSTYLQLPKNLDLNIKLKAQAITAGAKNMYSMAVALESYLRNNYTYDTNINLPAGQEAVSWFLFRSGNRGFCNYFATTMAVMARELGMPARVVTGYSSGTYDAKTREWVVRGSDAHAWTQIYFADYGWINFEPSASFPNFTRPLHTVTGPPAGTATASGSPTVNPKKKQGIDLNLQGSGGNGSTTGGSNDVGAQVRLDIGIVLLVLLVFILGGLLYFNFWWRRLFRNYGLPSQLFGRMSLLANWAGIPSRRSQTPYEYVEALSETVPDSAVTIERLGDIYVRDRWNDPASADHPRKTGEVNQLPGLWKTLEPRLFFYALRHPHFLRRIPEILGRLLKQRRTRPRRRGDDIIVVRDDDLTP